MFPSPWILLAVWGCGRTDQAILSDALTAAATSLPEAVRLCTQATESARGACELAIVQATPRAGLLIEHCAGLADPKAQDECTFQSAEAALGRGEIDLAVVNCAATKLFRERCADHVWTYTYATQSDEVERVLRKLRDAMPDVAHTLDKSQRGMRGKRIRADLKSHEELSESLCAEHEDPACLTEVAGLLRRRWLLAAEQLPQAKDELCRDWRAGRLPDPAVRLPGRPDLRWVSSPRLDAAIRFLQGEVCGG